MHEVVRDRLETFLAGARERSARGRGLPAFVERELRAYLDCGILARGFARARCSDCGFERLVASCKTHVCPSCATRRVEDGAAPLVPPPRVHSLRYHGVFAPHAGLRSRVVPAVVAHAATPPRAPAATGRSLRNGAVAAQLPRPPVEPGPDYDRPDPVCS